MHHAAERKTEHGCHLYNRQPDLVTNDAAQRFINEIEEEQEKGFGFVPFIGAGLSAPSGAPLVWEIKSYLERCIGLALGVEEPGMQPWNPRADQWPPFVDRARTPQDDWWTRVRDELERRRRDDPWDIEVAVFQEALGAMAEWRTALLFLSRLVREQRGTERNARHILALDAPDQEVIDACIREVMKGKQPTLGHRMLANLGGLLRLDIILSTNFDDLLERAFAAARNPLTLFEVHLNSSLPHWSALSGQRSLVKLHGHRHSLRADYTLDALPSESDRWRFLEYLLTAESRQKMFSELAKGIPVKRLQVQNHLLVMGFSAADRRTRSLIEHAWIHLGPTFKVIWLCHTCKDVDRVQTFTRDFLSKNEEWIKDMCPSNNWEGSRIIRHQYLGLLFLHLYQSIRHGLPTTGMIFPSVSRLPMPPMPRDADADIRTNDKAAAFRRKIEERLASFRRESWRDYKLIAVSSSPDATGITSLCADVYDCLQEQGIICLWLDMNDISSTDDLFEQLLDAAYYRLGAENWMPVFLAKNPSPRAAEIRRLSQSTSSPWVIFLNARETPGANTTDHKEMSDTARPNNWLDDARPTENPPESHTDEYSRCHDALGELLSELCGVKSPTISVVLLCRQSPEASPPPLAKALAGYGLIDRLDCLEHNYVSFDETKAIAESLKWTGHDPQKQRFIHALCLMQRTRLLSTIWSSAFSPPRSEQPAESVDAADRLAWLNDLEGFGLIRRKPGGFIWMHSRARNRLRDILWDGSARASFVALRPEVQEYFASWQPELAEYEIHCELSNWFRRVLAATNSPAAVFEAVHHACEAAIATLRLATTPGEIHQSAECIQGASALLQTHSFLIQTHGYSRGSCRRLEYIREKLCIRVELYVSQLPHHQEDEESVTRLKAATALLRVRCTEVMRAIAREVGEDRRAYQRQNEIRALFAVKPASEAESVSSEEFFKALFRPDSPGDRRSSDAGIEWMRWWKWNGMLGIASRSYEMARHALVRAILSASQFADLPTNARYPFETSVEMDDAQLIQPIAAIVSSCSFDKMRVCGHTVDDTQQARIEVLRIIEQIVAERLQVSSLSRRKGEDQQPVRERIDHKALRAIIRSGLTLADQALAHDQSADAHHTIPTMWCKSRLLMHDSICSTEGGEWREAMKLLADAEACLNYFDARRQGTDRALVELHRAEVRLWQANAMPVVANPTGAGESVLSFQSMCEVLSQREEREFLLWRTTGKDLYAKWFQPLDVPMGHPTLPGKTSAQALAQTKALVQDAIRFLGRGEQVLRNRRRNVWWTTWFFQRKLMAIAMSVWATIPERGTPIPYLGLEAAARKTPTLPDIVLEEAIRMSRVDSYRLATIVEQYLSCASALHLRLMLDADAVRLPERQKAMYLNCESAVARLLEVERDRDASRKQVGGLTPELKKRRDTVEEKAKVDDAITKYIKAVVNRAKRCLKYLKNPLV